MKHPQHRGGRGLHAKIVVGALVLTVLVGATPAQATLATATAPAPSAPSADAQKKAKEHFVRGKAFQDKDEFDAAIAEYKAAFALAPLPDLIFNIAQCERLKGDKRAALDDFQRYLVIAPSGRGAAEAHAFVASLGPEVGEIERRQKEQEKAEQARRESEAQARREADARRQEQARAEKDAPAGSEVEATVATTPPPALAPPPERTTAPAPTTEGPGSRLRLAGLVTAGVGAALVVTGAVFGLKARSASDSLDKLGQSTTTTDRWDQDLYDSGRSDEKKMFILVGVGTAAILGGGVTYLLGRRAETDHPALALVPSSNGATLTLAFALR